MAAFVDKDQTHKKDTMNTATTGIPCPLECSRAHMIRLPTTAIIHRHQMRNENIMDTGTMEIIRPQAHSKLRTIHRTPAVDMHKDQTDNKVIIDTEKTQATRPQVRSKGHIIQRTTAVLLRRRPTLDGEMTSEGTWKESHSTPQWRCSGMIRMRQCPTSLWNIQSR